jgi:hypothetical protein
MNRELPLNQIRPEAQPLSSFIQPAQRRVAEPAGPLEIPRVGQINVIQQGSGGSVAGANNFSRTAAALAPFNQELTRLAGNGLTLYAQSEVEKGVNEAMRAAALVNNQMQQSGAEYAAETRKLAQADPIAAMAMDTINPFRQAGRQRALMQVATLEAGSAMVSAYRANPDLVLEPAESGVLGELKATTTKGLLQKYGISETSPGFPQFISQLNQGADRVTEMHWRDRQDYLKSTIPETAAAEILGIHRMTVETGVLEIPLPDGGVMTFTRPRPDEKLPEAELYRRSLEWESGVAAFMSATLDRISEEMGLPGETTNAKRAALQRLLAVANSSGDTTLTQLLRRLPVGPRDAQGNRAPAVTFFAQEFVDSDMKYGEHHYKMEQRRQEQILSDYSDDVAQLTYGMPDGADRLKKLEELREAALKANPNLSRTELMEAEVATSKTVDAVTNLGRSVEPVSKLLLDMEGRYGTAWNPNQADAEMQAALAQAPDDEKSALSRQYAAIRDRKNREAAAPTTPQVNGVISRAVEAGVRAAYPDKINEANLRGADPMEVIAGITDANAKESILRQYSAYQPHVNAALAAATGEKGAPLTVAEAVKVATDAIAGYGKSDPRQKKYLFPGVDGQPGVGGSGAAPTPAADPSKPQLPPGTRPATQPVYPSGQLDNIPGRQSRLRTWRDAPVLDAASAITEGNRVEAGGAPSAALQRFAREAGTTPGALLNRHLDFYPGIKATPDFRQKLQRDGRQSQAIQSNARASTAKARQPVAQGYASRATNWMLNMLMPPAVAGQRAPMRSAVGLAGGNTVAINSSGGGRGVGGLLALIRSGEGDWNSVNFGTVNNTGKGIGTITNRSIGSLEAMQSRGQVFAIGAYQFTPGVLARARREAGLSPNAPFSPENQNKMAMALLTGTKRPALAAYLTGRSDDLGAAHWDVAREWAAVQAPNGRGVYDGDSAGNRASIPAARVRQMLIEARREITGR